MRIRLALILALVALVAPSAFPQTNITRVSQAPATFVPVDASAQVRQMQRGVNIIGYDPLWQDFEKRRFKEEYFKQLADAGFRTVRVNLHAFRHMDAMNRLEPSWFKTLDWVVDGATAQGLTVIIDEHDYNACGMTRPCAGRS